MQQTPRMQDSKIRLIQAASRTTLQEMPNFGSYVLVLLVLNKVIILAAGQKTMGGEGEEGAGLDELSVGLREDTSSLRNS